MKTVRGHVNYLPNNMYTRHDARRRCADSAVTSVSIKMKVSIISIDQKKYYPSTASIRVASAVQSVTIAAPSMMISRGRASSPLPSPSPPKKSSGAINSTRVSTGEGNLLPAAHRRHVAPRMIIPVCRLARLFYPFGGIHRHPLDDDEAPPPNKSFGLLARARAGRNFPPVPVRRKRGAEAGGGGRGGGGENVRNRQGASIAIESARIHGHLLERWCPNFRFLPRVRVPPARPLDP